jgi:hypothetical protein
MEIVLGLYMVSDTAKIHLLGLGLVSPLKGLTSQWTIQPRPNNDAQVVAKGKCSFRI